MDCYILYTYRWGICDVEDCCSGAKYLAKDKKVDGEKLCIDGGSAGGYTTLACLTFKNDFKAGMFLLTTVNILTCNFVVSTFTVLYFQTFSQGIIFVHFRN